MGVSVRHSEPIGRMSFIQRLIDVVRTSVPFFNVMTLLRRWYNII